VAVDNQRPAGTQAPERPEFEGVDDIPAEDIPAAVAFLTAKASALSAKAAALSARLLTVPKHAPVPTTAPSTDVITKHEAMAITGRTENWINHNWRKHGLASQDVKGGRLRWSRKRCEAYHKKHLGLPQEEF
jgi:hypothetical protein